MLSLIYSFLFLSLRAIVKGRNIGLDDAVLGFAHVFVLATYAPEFLLTRHS